MFKEKAKNMENLAMDSSFDMEFDSDQK